MRSVQFAGDGRTLIVAAGASLFRIEDDEEPRELWAAPDSPHETHYIDDVVPAAGGDVLMTWVEVDHRVHRRHGNRKRK